MAQGLDVGATLCILERSKFQGSVHQCLDPQAQGLPQDYYDFRPLLPIVLRLNPSSRKCCEKIAASRLPSSACLSKSPARQISGMCGRTCSATSIPRMKPAAAGPAAYTIHNITYNLQHTAHSLFLAASWREKNKRMHSDL